MLWGRLPNSLSLDSKGRLVLPLRLRDEIVAGGKVPDLHLGYLLDRCLYLHTEEMHREFLDTFGSVTDDTKANRLLRTMVHARFFPVGLDNANRVTIPASLIEQVGIKKEVVVVCMRERFELWPIEALEELESSGQEEFAANLEQVLERAGRRKAAALATEGDD